MKEKKNTFKKAKLLTSFFKTAFFLHKLVLQKFCYLEPEPAAGTGAGQDWTGSIPLFSRNEGEEGKFVLAYRRGFQGRRRGGGGEDAASYSAGNLAA